MSGQECVHVCMNIVSSCLNRSCCPSRGRFFQKIDLMRSRYVDGWCKVHFRVCGFRSATLSPANIRDQRMFASSCAMLFMVKTPVTFACLGEPRGVNTPRSHPMKLKRNPVFRIRGPQELFLFQFPVSPNNAWFRTIPLDFSPILFSNM